MRTSWRRLVAVIAVAALLQACAVPGGTVYAPGETGRVMRVEPAEVVSAREVTVSGLDDRQAAGWGTLVGATIAGSAAYGITGADNPAGVAVTIIATVVGGLAGLALEEQRRTRRGAEYILRDETGRTVALVQSLRAGETIYTPGTEVSLIHGARGFVRVVPAQA
jgi:outer membrane lipoprotein SlyB